MLDILLGLRNGLVILGYKLFTSQGIFTVTGCYDSSPFLFLWLGLLTIRQDWIESIKIFDLHITP